MKKTILVLITAFIGYIAKAQTKLSADIAANTIVLGSGEGFLIIDGANNRYAPGTRIIVKPGIYTNGLIVQNLKDVIISGKDVTVDGLSQTAEGFNSCLNLGNLNNVKITGFTTQNNGYRMLNINSRLVGVTLDSLSFINCSQGIYVNNSNKLIWDGTEKTVNLLNFKITNSEFINCGTNELGGGIEHGYVYNLVKNVVISNNIFTGGNPGDLIACKAVDGFKVFNNTIDGVNPTTNGDNRLIMMTGNGDAYNNKFTNYEGHAIAVWPVSFGKVVKTSHFYNNVCIGSRRYAAFEFQEFKEFAIHGITTKSDLIVNNNVCGDINTDHWTGYPGTFIDNYQFGYMGGKVTLTNNKGFNFFPVPTNNVYWNLAKPSVVHGNVYTAEQSK
ncbi:hypothetical protein FO440_13430 [Mucilaginibacter corticis]|uniref:Right handed beta helix domain-containing protein n=1 Tax=Mucilaginibacter corticis TaxID=2597670 RepID=A0A556MLD5_9SPHI|nr:hypothetical protein [Mucilaginibacter corticis]TSJ40741.1 hypothetical protein FO440_13430 [Mucilaginibacter corticis]